MSAPPNNSDTGVNPVLEPVMAKIREVKGEWHKAYLKFYDMTEEECPFEFGPYGSATPAEKKAWLKEREESSCS